MFRHRLLPVAIAAMALVPAAPSYATNHHVVDGQCTFGITAVPNSSQVVLVVAGYAAAPEHPGAVATSITCAGTIGAVPFTYSQANPGPFAAVAGQLTAPIGVVTICTTASAVWSDGHSKTVTHCP